MDRHEYRNMIILMLPTGIVCTAFFLLPMARLVMIGASGERGVAAYLDILTTPRHLESLIATSQRVHRL